MTDATNPAYMLQMIDAALLCKIVAGEIDVRELARRELAQRGLDTAGKWVGHAKAAKVHGIA